ncbi:MAG: universal stress protein [Verrucomicrobiota bacterium]|nr:universal stress protein [Verrucomicrobiota bacterium]
MAEEKSYNPSTVLCAVDFSAESRLALKYAGLGAKLYGARLIVLHAQRFELPAYFTPDQIETLTKQLDSARAGAEDLLRQYSRSALGPLADSLPTTYKVVDQHPVDAILETTGGEGANLVVLGTHGRGGAKRLWLGSVAENVATHSEVPVFVVRQKEHDFIDIANPESPLRLRTIIAPVDFSETSRAALRVSASIAERFEAKVLPVCVVRQDAASDLRRSEAMLKEWLGQVHAARCIVEPVTRVGHAAEQIISLINETNADLAVVGAENSRSSGHPLLGRTTKLVLRQAPVPVLVVPPGT